MPSKKAKKSKKKKGQEAEQSRASAKHAARFGEAAARGDCGAMGRLIEGGVDVNVMLETVNKDGRKVQSTALFQAVANMQAAAAQLLLDRGANPNLANSLGGTPLMKAAHVGSLPLMRLLLKAGAEVNTARPEAGATALHYACDYNHPDCAEALVRAGCNTSLRDMYGLTGRDIAREQGHTVVLERLDALHTGANKTMPTTKATKKSRRKNGGGELSGASAKRAARLGNAAKAGDCGALERLIEGGVDVDAKSETTNLKG